MGELLYRCQPEPCKHHPVWSRTAVIYELNVRQFSPEGNFAGVAAQLPRLRDLGVDLLWLMPIYPIGQEDRKGTLGSYYAIQDYCAVNPEFGTFDEFRQLVEQIHAHGLRVILDWVPNHTARDARWVGAHPDYYVMNPETGRPAVPFDWSDTAQLDYANPEMRRAMVGAMQFWLRETAIDGFRVDMAMLEPIDFWDTAIGALKKVRPDLFMLAEAEGPHFHRQAFDVSYAWELHHRLVDIANGRANVQSLREMLRAESEAYPLDAFRMFFTSNHDENSWKGSEFDRFGPAVRTMAALTYFLPGIPLIYNGQEVASKQRLAFFDRDPIRWNEGDPSYTLLYQRLNHLRHTHPALASGAAGGDLVSIDNSSPEQVFSAKRSLDGHTVIGLFNLSPDPIDLAFYDEEFDGEYSQLESPESALLRSGAHFYLPPWGFFLYSR